MMPRHRIALITTFTGLMLATGIASTGESQPVLPKPENDDPFGVPGINLPRPKPSPEPPKATPAPMLPEQSPLLSTPAEMETAVRKLLEEPYRAYLQAVDEAKAAILSRAEEMKSSCYINSVDQYGNSQLIFDPSLYSALFAKLENAKRQELDPKYKAIEKLREQFLVPYRSAARTDTSIAAKDRMLLAIQVTAKWSAKKH